MKWKFNQWTRCGLLALLMLAGAAWVDAAPGPESLAEAPVKPGNGVVVQFAKPFPKPARQVSQTDGNFDHQKERFLIYVPPTYTGREPFGLIVFMDPGTAREALPAGWQGVLDQRRFIFIAPQNVGNDQPNGRRNGLALTSAVTMLHYYNIDRSKVYAAGFSGGARIACDIAFYAPEVFKGTIQSCGTNFNKTVPKVAVTAADTAAHPEPYGVAKISQAEADGARAKVKFVMITGPGDFRYRYIQDIYNGGFKPGHFKATLLDIPELKHEVCGGPALEAALGFLAQP